jgi:hypothetical protein
MDYVALKAELDAGHPGTGAYNVDDTLAAAELNTVNRTTNKTIVTGDELFTSTDGTEFGALTDHKRSLWVSFCSKDIDPFASANVTFVTWVFGGGSNTVSTLATVRINDVSRAVELSLGTVDAGHIQYARTL